MKFKESAKAYIGAAIAGLTATSTALDDGTVTLPEALGIVVAALVAFGAVWAVPNKTEPADDV